MKQPEFIITAHYNAVRDEEMERIKQRDRYVVLYFTGYAAIVAFSVSQQNFGYGTLVIPILTLFFSIMYCHTDLTVGALSNWLQTDYSDNLEYLCAANGIETTLHHWDGSTQNTQYYKSFSFLGRYYSILFMVLCINVSSLIIIYLDRNLAVTQNYEIFTLGYFCLFSLLSVLAFLWTLYERAQQTKRSDEKREKRAGPDTASSK